jgi:hypothetical protein
MGEAYYRQAKETIGGVLEKANAHPSLRTEFMGHENPIRLIEEHANKYRNKEITGLQPLDISDIFREILADELRMQKAFGKQSLNAFLEFIGERFGNAYWMRKEMELQTQKLKELMKKGK